jgi:hypothetical protein
MAFAIVGFSQEYIQQPTRISTWTYVEEYDWESPFNKDITLQYDERGNLSYYYHIINYPTPYYSWKWFTHDALNRLTVKQEYSQEASYWWNYKHYYTYDDSSNLLECLVMISDRYTQYFTDEYIIDSKDVYQYENGKRTRWDHFTDSTLVLQYYYLYEYDDDAWSSETRYKANGQPVTKTEYTYSDKQEVLTKTVANWSTETRTWCNSSLTEYTYSDNQEVLSVTISNWSTATETWLNSSLTEYEYSDGFLIEKRTTNWSNDEISQQQKQIYHYNENGNCTQILFQTLVDSVYVDKNKALYLYDENGLCTNANAKRWADTTWAMGVFPSGTYLFFDDIYADVNNMVGTISGCSRAEVTEYVNTPNPQYVLTPLDLEGEWFYEIENEDGSITFQHLECAADTTINNERPKVIVRSNTHYDRDSIYTEVTHEYVYEDNGKVYWWNKDLEEFTTLYDLTAEAGDEWTIKVGTESITMHVDSIGYYEYNGLNYRTLHVSDENNLFIGDIVCSFGHMTSFFPERLMNRSANFIVNGLRCYWEEEVLLYHNGNEDCDAIYSQIHDGVNETTEDAAFAVYPNPTNGVLFVETQNFASLPGQTATYRITNVLGQTVLSGNINAETQPINIKELPSGMYFITVDEQTVKFVVK